MKRMISIMLLISGCAMSECRTAKAGRFARKFEELAVKEAASKEEAKPVAAKEAEAKPAETKQAEAKQAEKKPDQAKQAVNKTCCE